MGLDLYAHGCKTEFHLSYGSFSELRKQIAYLYNEEFGEIYSKSYNYFSAPMTHEERDCLYEVYEKEKGIGFLLNHSDCDGILTYYQCKHIYKLLSKLDITKLDEDWKNAYLDLKSITEYCAKNKRRLYFC